MRVMVMAVDSGSSTFDGTQPPPPPELYPDPLAGLVTGESPGETDRFSSFSDGFQMPAAPPVEVDTEAVQAMVEAALADPSTESTGRHRPSDSAFPATVGQPFLPSQRGSAGGVTTTPTPGMLPAPQRTRPSGQQAWQALRSYPRQYRAQAQQRARPPLPVKPSKNSAGVIVAIVLLVVFGIIAIQLIAGVIEGISNTFE